MQQSVIDQFFEYLEDDVSSIKLWEYIKDNIDFLHPNVIIKSFNYDVESTTLIEATVANKELAILILKNIQGIDCNIKDECGSTALRYALQSNASMELIELLLQQGADASTIEVDTVHCSSSEYKENLKEIFQKYRKTGTIKNALNTSKAQNIDQQIVPKEPKIAKSILSEKKSQRNISIAEKFFVEYSIILFFQQQYN